MCGIAGIMLSSPGSVGQSLVGMLDGCQHRGPDSTGFALYRESCMDYLVCRVYLGQRETSGEAEALAEKIFAIVESYGGKILQSRFEYQDLRFELQFCGDVKELSYTIENNVGVEIFSIGSSLEICKGVGTAMEVDEKYNVSTFTGTHGIGHVRLATESKVCVNTAHPFWAYGFSDVAIVHNGQITNYHKMKRRLVQRGFQFRTENDSELIAVYLADKLSLGDTLDEILAESVEELDGTFSFLVATADAIGFAKDKLAAKPMVVLERDHLIAVASEEVSLNRLFPGEALSTYEPFPGAHKTWRLSTLAARA